MATVTELVTEFSFTGSEAPLNRYNRSLNQSIALLASMAAVLAASGAAVSKWASGVLQGERSMYNLSFETGIAIEKLQQLNFVAEMSGASSQAMQSSMESLSAAIGDAAQKGSDDFARLGIAVRDANGHVRSADNVLRDVQTRFKKLGLSMAEQRSFASALGIDTSLLRMMNQTSGQISELMVRAQELGTLNKSQAAQAEQYNQALVVQRFAMDGLRRLIAVGLAPELTRMVDKFTGLIERNKEWIIDGVQVTLEVLNDLTEMLGRVWPLLAVGVGVFVALKIAALGFTGVMGILLSPVVLFTAGLAAVVLIVDDLIVAFRGGKSVIRDFFLEFFGYDIQPVLKEIVRGFTKMIDGSKIMLKGYWDFFRGIFSAMGKLMVGDFKGSFDDIKKAFKDLWTAAFKSFYTIYGEALKWVEKKFSGLSVDFDLSETLLAFENLWISVKDSFKSIFGEALQWLSKKITGIIPDWAKDIFGNESNESSERKTQNKDRATIGNELFREKLTEINNNSIENNIVREKLTEINNNSIENNIGREKYIYIPSDVSPGSSKTVNTKSSTINQEVEINVRTSDPERAARLTADNLQRQMTDAQTQSDRGGM